MSRHRLSLTPEQLTAFDLDALIAHAERLNEHNGDYWPRLETAQKKNGQSAD